jgi:hypothetical protein
MSRYLVIPLALCLGALASAPARANTESQPAQSATIIEIPNESVQLLDPSIEAAGMGGASSAVFWQENPNDHANPALVGFHHGLRYSFGQTKLYESLIEDVQLRTDRVLAAAWGIGVAMSGKPDKVGRVRLSYPEQTFIDEFGNPLAPMEPHQDVRTLAVGVSVIDLVSNIMESMGGAPLTIQPRVSLAVGHAWKEVAIDMAPPEVLGGARVGKGENRDAGAVLRIAPMDQIGRDLDAPRRRAQYRLELAGAYSRLNYVDDERINYEDGHGEEMPDIRQYGASARLTMAFAPNEGTSWYRDWAAPAVFMALAWDHADIHRSTVGPLVADIDYTTRIGSELSVFDVFFLRLGHVEDYVRDVEGTTYGAGVSLKYKNAIGVRGDWAHYPVQDVLDQPWNRYGVSVFVDPFHLKPED